MRTGSDSRATPARLWTDAAWPVLAGTLAAMGLYGASRSLGFAQFLVVYIGVSIFTVVWVLAVAFSAYQELGGRGPRLVRVGLAVALVGMALLGLAQLFAGYGLLAAAAVVLTSPAATRLLAGSRGSVGGPPTTPRVDPVLMDQEMADHEFDDIVSHLREMDDHFPEI